MKSKARGILSLVLLIVLCANHPATVTGSQSAQTPPPRVRLPGKPLPNFLKTQEWILLAKAHEIGMVDEPVRTLATWSVNDLKTVDRDIHLIRYTIDAATIGLPRARDIGAPAFVELVALLDLPKDTFEQDGAGFGDGLDVRILAKPTSRAMVAIAKVMVQIAMLNMDLALAAFDDKTLQRAPMPSNTIRVTDADRAQVADLNIFWEDARQAMDIAEPTPWGGPLVHDWYVATSEYLLGRRDYAVGLRHMEHARLTVPGEARIALYLGAVYENMASPAIQAALGDYEASVLGPRPALLGKAEYQLRSALLLEPDFPMVSLRLGRTLQLKGRNDEALPFLARAEEGVGLTELQYAAALFSGLAYRSLERDDDARSAFQRAAMMFPQAQTPKLALAQMALRTSGQEEALVHLRSLNSAATTDRTADPWWVYDIGVAPAGADRIDAVRMNVREALR